MSENFREGSPGDVLSRSGWTCEVETRKDARGNATKHYLWSRGLRRKVSTAEAYGIWRKETWPEMAERMDGDDSRRD